MPTKARSRRELHRRSRPPDRTRARRRAGRRRASARSPPRVVRRVSQGGRGAGPGRDDVRVRAGSGGATGRPRRPRRRRRAGGRRQASAAGGSPRQARRRARRRRHARRVRPRLGSRDGREGRAVRGPGARGAAAEQQDGCSRHSDRLIASSEFDDPSNEVFLGTLAADAPGATAAGSALTLASPSTPDIAIVMINGFDAVASKDALPFRVFLMAERGQTPPCRQDQGARLRRRRDPLAAVRAEPLALHRGRGVGQGRQRRAPGHGVAPPVHHHAVSLTPAVPVVSSLPCVSGWRCRSTGSRSRAARWGSRRRPRGLAGRRSSGSTPCGCPITSSTRSPVTAAIPPRSRPSSP